MTFGRSCLTPAHSLNAAPTGCQLQHQDRCDSSRLTQRTCLLEGFLRSVWAKQRLTITSHDSVCCSCTYLKWTWSKQHSRSCLLSLPSATFVSGCLHASSQRSYCLDQGPADNTQTDLTSHQDVPAELISYTKDEEDEAATREESCVKLTETILIWASYRKQALLMCFTVQTCTYNENKSASWCSSSFISDTFTVAGAGIAFALWI